MVKNRVYDFLNKSRIGGIVLGALIFLSIFLFCVETEFPKNKNLSVINLSIAMIFAFEYLLRIWSAQCENTNIDSPRSKYIFSFFGIIDLLAFLPVLISPLFSGSLLLRCLRVLRLLQLLKIRSLSVGIFRISRALREAKSELIVAISVSILLIFVGAVAMYYVEGQAQPEQFGSVPRALWWSMATLTTVGYGDVYPVTVLGKIIASSIAVVGIAAVAMPSGILAAAFIKAKD